MSKVWCVRADFGLFTKQFREGGFAGIGWEKMGDLSGVFSRDELYPIYKASCPEDTSNTVIGIQVGQVARFVLEIASGDVAVTPDNNTELLWHGVVEKVPRYFYVPRRVATRTVGPSSGHRNQFSAPACRSRSKTRSALR
jgi:restriction system protein